MLKFVLVATAAVALAAAGIAVAGLAGSTHSYRASLGSGAEVPKPKAPAGAGGVFTATVTESGSTRTVRWKLTFHGLSGKAMAAHVHKGRAGVAGAVIVPLCGPCKSGQTGQVKVSKNTADVLESGLAYVNVHTAKNAAGEIRGQVKASEGPPVVGPAPPPPPSPEPPPDYPYP